MICSTSSDSESDADENISNKSLNIDNTSEFPDLHTFQNRSKNNFITSKLAIALDRCKISDSDAVHILTATAVEAFGIHVNDLILIGHLLTEYASVYVKIEQINFEINSMHQK